MKDIESNIKQLLAAQSPTGKALQDLQLTDSLQFDLKLDSLAMIELLVGLEEAFEISISDEDLLTQEEWMQTVGSLIDFVTTWPGRQVHP